MSTELEFLDTIKGSFENLKAEKSNPSKDKKILRKIRKLKTPKNEELRLNAAQVFLRFLWIVLYNMTEFNKSENEKQVETLLKTANNDLKHVLRLLDKEFENDSYKLHALLLIADVAQKLSDFTKLSEVYKKISTLSSLNPQMAFVALSIAPSLADWKIFHRICTTMEKDCKNYANNNAKAGANRKAPKIGEVLHQMSQPGTPDFGIIFEIVQQFELQKIKTPRSSKLFEQSVEVKRVEIEIEKIVAESDARMNEIKDQFEKEKETEFQLEGIGLSVNGGLILIPGLSKEVSLMLAGPYFDSNNIVVEGYVDLQLQELDQNGNPKKQISPEEMNAEFMKHMPPELLDAIESGQVSPEMVMEAISHFANPSAAPGSSNNPLLSSEAAGAAPQLRQSLAKMAQKFEEIAPEIMSSCGLSMVRQQERMELKKSEKGYEGTYFVRNYNSLDGSEETSIMLRIKMDCEHLSEQPAGLADLEEDILTGVDDLSLE